MNKIMIILLSSILFNNFSFAQSIGIGTPTPDASSLLEIKSNTKGLLIPRTSTASRLAIASPAKGLMLYDTTTSSFWFHNGTEWTEITTTGSGWGITGNAGTNPAVHFIGTTDDKPVLFRMNNQFAGKIDSLSFNTLLGFGTGTVTIGSGNSALGYKCLSSNTTGFNNTAIGTSVLNFNTLGNENTGIGVNALFSNTDGNRNIALGSYCLFTNSTGHSNTATGYSSLYNNTSGFFNTANGYNALFTNDNGIFNTAVGALTLYNNSSSGNSAFGYHSLFENTTGGANTAIGTSSTVVNTTGSGNTATGFLSLNSNTTGNNNTATGYNTLSSNRSGNQNTVIGYNADVSTFNLNNATAIGANTLVNASDKVVIGSPSTIDIGGYANWTNFSDGRFKENIQEDVPGLSFIIKLKPVTYQINKQKLINHITRLMPDSIAAHYKKTDAEYASMYQKRFTGFVAQAVEQAAKEMGYDFDGVNAPRNETDHYSISYATFVVPLVKAVQEQQIIIEEQQKKINCLIKEIETIKIR